MDVRTFSSNRWRRNVAFCGLLILSLALVLDSCSSRPGYGVVLWSKDESAVKTGDIVRIRAQSQLSSSYLITTPHGKKNIEIATWRIATFKREQDAINYAAAYAPFVTETARARSAGVVLYQDPSAASQRVYRMRPNQEVKVISRTSVAAASGGQAAAWYEVLTGDGALGYCQDIDLVLGQGQAQGSQGTTLDTALSQTYRPASFQEMIDSGHIDLTKFAPQFGFFPDPKAHTLRIVTPKSSVSYSYSAAKDLGDGLYSFAGTPVQLSLLSPNQIQLQYAGRDGKQVSEKYFAMSDDEVKLAIEKEHNRRLLLYGTFLDKGGFRSDYYGTISFASGMTFTWSGFSRLQPDVIPRDVEGDGTVDFPLFLDDTLAGSYDGAITFRFRGPTGETPVSFLYSFRDGGLRLTYIPPTTVTDNVVNQVASSPIITYFSYNR